MNCFYHSEIISVSVCQDCHKGLCHDCGTKYSIPICSQCNHSRKSIEKGKINTELMITFGSGLLFALLFTKNWDFIETENYIILVLEYLFIPFIGFYAGASIIAGWKTLNSITPSMFMILPLIGWVIYFCIKLWLTGMIGGIMLPIRTFKNFRRLKQLKEIPK